MTTEDLFRKAPEHIRDDREIVMAAGPLESERESSGDLGGLALPGPMFAAVGGVQAVQVLERHGFSLKFASSDLWPPRLRSQVPDIDV